MERNCKNCGAPINVNKSKCDYCDTPYKLGRSEKELQCIEVINKERLRVMVSEQNRAIIAALRIGGI